MESRFDKVKRGWLALLLLLMSVPVFSQNYYGIQGSSYAGSLGIANNPASMVNTPFKWDVTVFSVQEKHATNGVRIYNYSLLSNPQNSQYKFTEGDYRRFAYTDFNVHLLNARIALSRTKALAFGINLRGYGQASIGSINFIDSLKTTRNFFDLGNFDRRLYGDFTSSSWIELFASWGQTVWDRTDSRLNAGITLKVSRGISGAYTSVQNGQVLQTQHGNRNSYTIKDGTAEYAYSSNYDQWQKEKSTRQNLRDFLHDTRGGYSVDLGVEYIIKPQTIATVFDDDESYYDYDWKIGLSLLDIGFNQYKYGNESRMFSGIADNVTDTVVDQRFLHVESLKAFNDSLVGAVQNLRQPPGHFRVVNPARLVLNVDRYLFNAFYINGNLSLNLSSVSANPWRMSELNLLTITPRWETKRWGVYMPVQFNTKNQFWIGGAFKAGPLLLGVHNWANVFSKNKMANGGAYLALVIRAWKNTRTKLDKRLDCPR